MPKTGKKQEKNADASGSEVGSATDKHGADNSDYESVHEELPETNGTTEPEANGGDDGEEEDVGEPAAESNDVAAAKKGRKRGKPKDGAAAVEEAANGVAGAKKARKTTAVATKAARKAQGKVKGKPAATDVAEDEVGEEETEYEVQDIVDEKKQNGVLMYRIRWKGYGADDDTWEAEDSLSCPHIIAKYKKSKANKPGPSSSKKKQATAAAGRAKGKAKAKPTFDPQEEFVVEKIIDYAVEKGGRVFRIRWRGYPASQDTWEPESNLSCPDLIEKFLKKMKGNDNANFKELRTDLKKPKRLVDETAPRTNVRSKVERVSKRSAKKRVYYGDSD